MIIEIISTGEEVLSGQIVDTNAPWISAELAEHHIEVSRRLTIGDRYSDLVGIFRERSQQADIILVTGGLGPTSDDMSSKAMADAMGEAWRLFPEWWEELQRRFAAHHRVMDPQNIQQATLPNSATILNNPIGTACGFSVKFNRATFYFMPGVPVEMKKMFREIILPDILKTLDIREQVTLQIFQTFGGSESKIGRLLSNIPLPNTITLGYRAKIPTVEIKMISRGASQMESETVATQIRNTLGDIIFSETHHDLASTLQELMIQQHYTLTTAESCTGGMLSSTLVEISGSSEYFERGYVTYSNLAKTEMLEIPMSLIEEKGAVSQEVAEAMAHNARRLAKTDFALSITGIAGPLGGSLDKPVGTVAFGLATPTQVYSQLFSLPPWDRRKIREFSTAIAIDMLRRYLQGLDVLATNDFVRTT